MKLQNLAIIFLVISIPLIIILSYYLDLQQDTLELQAAYDSKLAEAAKEGIKAFEINTVDWSNSKQDNRKYTIAMINAFITSLSNNLNLSGTAKEYMVNYIPAITVNLYDGYYVYAPTYVPITKENKDGVQLFDDGTNRRIATTEENNKTLILYRAKEGTGQTYTYEYFDDSGTKKTETVTGVTTNIEQAEREYKHTLSSKIQYSSKYKNTDGMHAIVNYTLDNRMYIYGYKNSQYFEKDGYLIYLENNTLLPRITINKKTPSAQRTEADITVDRSIINTVYNRKISDSVTHTIEIDTETLTEQIIYKNESTGQPTLETFKYLYDIEHRKLYYDDNQKDFFTLRSDKTREFLNNVSDTYYKSVSVLVGDEDTTEYKKIYQALNGDNKGNWYISIRDDTVEGIEEIDTQITADNLLKLGLNDEDFAAIYKDYSAISYYVEAYAFTNWVENNLGGTITCETTNETFNGLFKTSYNNDPENENSQIVQHKKEVMKNNINKNLNLSISTYNRNGKYDFKLPILKDSDWDNIFRNVSITAFFQGVPIGLKYYNNYAIATSTLNREYVDPGEIYFSGEDVNYHRVYCSKCLNKVYTGYRSVEFVLKEYDGIYYYEHDNSLNDYSETACYYCVINKANYKIITNDVTDAAEKTYKQAKSYNEALARERYYQYQVLRQQIGDPEPDPEPDPIVPDPIIPDPIIPDPEPEPEPDEEEPSDCEHESRPCGNCNGEGYEFCGYYSFSQTGSIMGNPTGDATCDGCGETVHGTVEGMDGDAHYRPCGQCDGGSISYCLTCDTECTRNSPCSGCE